VAETGAKLELSGRHHDRAAARGACAPGEIAETAEFFSFGTNDLTQTTFGISRDDAGLPRRLYRKGILEKDPFVSLDQEGVGELIKIAAERGRKTRPDSSSASAASMAAIRPRSRSATRSASITSPARPTACRSRGSPRRRLGGGFVERMHGALGALRGLGGRAEQLAGGSPHRGGAAAYARKQLLDLRAESGDRGIDPCATVFLRADSGAFLLGVALFRDVFMRHNPAAAR
jgi:hypothetical protein